MLAIAKALWAYRGFIMGSVKREFQVKYRSSMLGAFWNIINPLAMITVYTLIFSKVMQARLPGVENDFAYSVYLCAGMLTWGLFAEIVGRGQNIFLEHANLLKKLSFPRFCLPAIVVLSAGLSFAIIFSLFTLFLILSGNFPGWVWFAVFPVLLIQTAFAVGLGMILGVLNVFFRDVGQFFTIFTQFWFWLTPIVYSSQALPASAQSWLAFNPMTNLVVSYQRILVRGLWPEWQSLWFVTLLALALCFMGLVLFRKHSGEMVDEL